MGPYSGCGIWAGLDLGWVKAESHGQTVQNILCEMGRFGQKGCAVVLRGDYDADGKVLAVAARRTG